MRERERERDREGRERERERERERARERKGERERESETETGDGWLSVDTPREALKAGFVFSFWGGGGSSKQGLGSDCKPHRLG